MIHPEIREKLTWLIAASLQAFTNANQIWQASRKNNLVEWFFLDTVDLLKAYLIAIVPRLGRCDQRSDGGVSEWLLYNVNPRFCIAFDLARSGSLSR
jgi:hypothetical protein